MIVAQCIVDVPHANTNKVFDYKVPRDWEEDIRVGLRVAVPFGNRCIQGFIVRLTNESERTNLKEIAEVLDFEPVLTEELLQLGKIIADETVCYLITAYSAMLPSALKMESEKIVVHGADFAHSIDKLQHVFRGEDSIHYNELMALFSQKQVLQFVKERWISVTHVPKNLAKKKKMKIVKWNMPLAHIEEAIQNYDARAKKQCEWLQFLLKTKQTKWEYFFLTKTAGMSGSILKALVEKGFLSIYEEEVYRQWDEQASYEQTVPLKLKLQQQEAYDQIVHSLGTATVHCLFGVTGSGKTEVYMQTIDTVLQQEKEAIVLVPEISLTPQMVYRFKGRFGDKVAVLHSGLSVGEKFDEWRKILRGEVSVVVGARSAIFAPFRNLGLIIIDEEHESSYKQDENPRYHARDVAILRSRYYNCPVVLGSATPSLETFARAEKNVYNLITMSERSNEQSLPTVEITDMRDELRKGNRSMFSTVLLDAIKERIQRNEQVVLFLNRRGHSTFVLCRDCGASVMCPHCDVTLTYHKRQHELKCHYCDFVMPMPTHCPTCQSEHIRYFGAGTQKVEEELTKLMPHVKVIRMDVDTTSRKGAHERLLTSFGNGEAHILLGTQMIAKGLDFPRVTLVGVLSADTMLHIPDFRASEKTFQLLTQVSGRAGRHHLPGEVVIQTYQPEHYAIQLAKTADFRSFYTTEMRQRRMFQYPPYTYMVLVQVNHENPNYAYEKIEAIATFLRAKLQPPVYMIGPNPSPIPRIKERYRFQLLIKYKREPEITNHLKMILDLYQTDITKNKLHISIDMQPLHVM